MGAFASGFVAGFGSGFWGVVLERFASLSWEHISLIWGVDKELHDLHKRCLKIQSLMENIEGRLLKEKSCSWKVWFEEVRYLAADIDILLDNVNHHLSHYSRGIDDGNQILCNVVLSLKMAKLRLPLDISRMQERSNKLITELDSLLMIEKLNCTRPVEFSSSACFVKNESLVGRADDMDIIVKLLTTQSSCGVIPIVGVAGVGKTALACAIYNTERLPFQKRVWIHVTEHFDAKRMMKSVIEQLTRRECGLSDLYSLSSKARRLLSGRQVLFVFDDYWSESCDDWEIFSSTFEFSSGGNVALVTTQSKKVSLIVGSENARELQNLSDGDCWELIKQKTLPIIPANGGWVESVGIEIAKKCKGSPLVAAAFGDMLSSRTTESEWDSVLENELWDMPQGEAVFCSLIRVYFSLSPHMRKCFAYCSMFPEKYEYDVDELVLLWMSQGLIIPSGSMRLEDLGTGYFADMYSRSLFEQTPDGALYKMHGLVHEIARLVSRGVCLYGTAGRCPLFGDIFHLGLINDGAEPLQYKATEKNERLRSLVIISSNPQRVGDMDADLFSSCQSLRALGLRNLGITKMPKSFHLLKYLRYLNLSENQKLHLPDCICGFVALETLKLRGCTMLNELPSELSKLFNLRHLELDENCKLPYMPSDFRRLKVLQTLTLYVVGSLERNGITELQDMDSLGGSLCLKNLELVSGDDAARASLRMKKRLETLELHWTIMTDDVPDFDNKRAVQGNVLRDLQPHACLSEIAIHNYCGTVYPDWLSDRTHKFTKIHLEGLKYCNKLPCLGELECLKTIVIKNMPSLVDIGDKIYGKGDAVKFPKLENFRLQNLPALIRWDVSNDDSAMPGLIRFAIIDCPLLISLPPKVQLVRHISEFRNSPGLVVPPP